MINLSIQQKNKPINKLKTSTNEKRGKRWPLEKHRR